MRPRGPDRSDPAPSLGDPSEALEHVVSTMEDGLLVVDDEGRIRFANPAVGSLLGIPLEDLLGSEFGFPVSRGLVTEIDLVGGSEGARVAQMRVAPTRWIGQPAFVAALRDVTEYKDREAELTQQLSDRTAAVASASHELQNPLTSVRLAARLLADYGEEMDDDDRSRHLATILRNSRRITLLIRNMLTASRFEAGALTSDPQPVDVAERLLYVINDLEEQAADIDVNCETDLVAVFDADHFTQIITNFVTNGLKYGEPPVQIIARRADRGVEVRVIDHGDGVPSEFEPHLFERFARARETRDDVQGTGLGLSITRILAEASGGTVRYEPTEPGGAAFILWMPLTLPGR